MTTAANNTCISCGNHLGTSGTCYICKSVLLPNHNHTITYQQEEVNTKLLREILEELKVIKTRLNYRTNK